MAYDEGLAERLRDALADRDDVAEKRMFGGIAFMVRGHMSVGVVKDDLCARVGPQVTPSSSEARTRISAVCCMVNEPSASPAATRRFHSSLLQPRVT